jgi:type II restriction enzyme
MISPLCERAISEALRLGNAILKYISPNDVGLTGGHQCGYYLPKNLWEMFTTHPPEKGRNADSAVQVMWQEDRVTESRVKWYGKGTRSEYRLTRFGRNFPFLTADSVGDLLVLVPESYERFNAYVLDLEEDIEEIQAALGVEVIGTIAAYRNGTPQVESEEECIERRFRDFVKSLAEFPPGRVFSEQTQASLVECVPNFNALVTDDVLLRCMDAEYRLFRLAERQICQPEVVRIFKDVDDFLATASSIMNRRKSRAGRSLENHFEYLLRRAGIPYAMRPNIEGRPDVVIPSVEAYRNRNFPVERLTVIGIKTTCKDRWRQILNEARRVPHKHILTIQKGISSNQLREMRESNVTVIVPRLLHKDYPPRKRSGMALLTLEQFIAETRGKLN